MWPSMWTNMQTSPKVYQNRLRYRGPFKEEAPFLNIGTSGTTYSTNFKADAAWWRCSAMTRPAWRDGL